MPNTWRVQSFSKHVKDFDLVFSFQLIDHIIDFWRIGSPDKAGNVHVDKGSHQILTIKTVHDATVTRDDVAKVLDFEGSLEATGKKPPNGPMTELNSDKASECNTNGYMITVCGKPNYKEQLLIIGMVS